MNIKSQKDFFSGLLFTVVGLTFAWGATKYNMGTAARMGPGYFPMMLPGGRWSSSLQRTWCLV